MTRELIKAALLCSVLGLAACSGDDDGDKSGDNNSTQNNSTLNNGQIAECVFDVDCADGEACEAAMCQFTCVDDQDCAVGEVCVQGINTELFVCRTGAPTNSGTNNTSTNNASTNNASTNNASTNNASTNNASTNNASNDDFLYNVYIVSASAGAESCDDVFDPGPDIFAVGLEDAAGNPLGWGEVMWEELQLDNNDFVDTSIIDGNAPSLGADNCPDEFDGNVVSLGCEAENYIVVRFVDDAAQPIGLVGDASQFVRVYEWGGQCGGTLVDEYDVYVCDDTLGSQSGDTSTCIYQVMVGANGEASGAVTGF